MFDIGWSELLVIGVVSLVVVGPKDLPGMFRSLGRITAKARSMAREFSRAMEDAADGTGVREAAQDFRDLTSKKSLGLDTLEQAASSFEKWEPKLPSGVKAPAVAGAAAPLLAADDPYDDLRDDESFAAPPKAAAKRAPKAAATTAPKAAAPKAAASKSAPKSATKSPRKPKATDPA